MKYKLVKYFNEYDALKAEIKELSKAIDIMDGESGVIVARDILNSQLHKKQQELLALQNTEVE